MTLQFTDEQQKAYKRFIAARDKVGIVRTEGYTKRPWVRQATVTQTVDVEGLNHPLFEENDEFIEYLEASSAWWRVEPEFRKTERMSAIRGDYGASDSWNEESPRLRDTYSITQGDE
jgi:hypothetical protein